MAASLKPDVVLLDMGCQASTAFSGEQMRIADSGLRLIAITGYGQPQARERADHHRQDAFVKPIDAAELSALADVSLMSATSCGLGVGTAAQSLLAPARSESMRSKLKCPRM